MKNLIIYFLVHHVKDLSSLRKVMTQRSRLNFHSGNNIHTNENSINSSSAAKTPSAYSLPPVHVQTLLKNLVGRNY